MKEFGLENIIFVCIDSTEIFFSKLRSAGLNYNMPNFSLTLTVYLISIAYLTFFIFLRICQVFSLTLTLYLRSIAYLTFSFFLEYSVWDSPLYISKGVRVFLYF